MSHSTVSHRWFHQIGNKKTGSNSYDSGNMFYNDKIIYSYWNHFALAIRFEDIVVINSEGYSSSTSKHFGHVYSSLDRSTHDIINVPLKEAYNFDNKVEFKNVYKYINFQYFIREYKENIKKLANARKPQKYTSEIEGIQSKLKHIFETWRGAKTLALKTKGINSILKFEFSEETREKLKESRLQEIKKREATKKAAQKTAMKNLIEYENGEYLKGHALNILDINTAIRVKADTIETSKGMKIDLAAGLRVFKLWKAGKGLGVEIKTKDGHLWKCTKVNGIIKFGCHEIDFKQANRVLNPYL